MTLNELTKEEAELITYLRNYRKAYPNGAKWMNDEIKHLVLVLKDPSYYEAEE